MTASVLDEKCPACDETLRGGRTIQAGDGRWVHYMTGCFSKYNATLNEMKIYDNHLIDTYDNFPGHILEQNEYPGISTMELPELDNLEKADTFVKMQSEKVQAYLYKALYLNDMRIDKAETIIARDKK